MSALRVQATATGVRISIRVQPRASSNAVAGVHGDALKVRLSAPPVDGAANEALVDFLAGTFGIPPRDVTIVAGSSSRSKIVELTGVTEDRVRRLAET
ncbi:MAG TPA: DUF167 domain-containing protein [Gemmatimonadaceae bacterium]|nr:DUF167 domain-containing protein [Gemmatimonadaceae bacterium]